MNTPRVSVIMSVYNAEEYVHKTIDSILNQNFTDFEFLIIDDCSRDKSYEIISSYNDSRIKVFKNEINQGYIPSLNKLINDSKGEYIARQDHDDISLPDRLKLQVKYMERNLDVGVCGTNAIFFGKKNWHTSLPENNTYIRATMIFRNPIIHSSVMIRRSLFVLEDAMEYSLSHYPSEDYFLWYKISTKYKLANLAQALLMIRWHDNNVSNLNGSIQIEKFKEIRYEIIEQTFSIELTEEEKRLHDLIPMEKNISPGDISLLGKWYLKMLTLNKEKKCISDYSLHKVILIYWTIACFRVIYIPLIQKISIYFSSKIFNFAILLNLISLQNLKNLFYKYQ